MVQKEIFFSEIISISFSQNRIRIDSNIATTINSAEFCKKKGNVNADEKVIRMGFQGSD